MAKKRRNSNGSLRPKKRRKTVSSIPRTLITPKTKIVHLRYIQAFDLDPAAGTVASHSFRANSCFDPDFAIGGGQPAGFDQWSVFYNNYEVERSVAKLEVLPSNSSSGPSALQLLVLLKSRPRSTVSTGPLTLLEQRSNSRTAYGQFGGGRDTGGNLGVMVMRNSFKMRRDMGHGSNSHTEANFDANPSEDWFFVVEAANPYDVTINPGIVHCVLTIDYRVRLSDLKVVHDV